MAQPYDLPLHELERYKPELTKEQDFDKFWEKTLEELNRVPLEVEMTPHDYPAKGVSVHRIAFRSYGGARIEGWLAMPKGKGPHPGLALFHGYNWAMDGNLHDTVNWAAHGYAALQMFCRGQHGGSQDTTIYSNGGPAGWMTRGILSPEEYYYRAVYMDTVRAVEVLASLEQVDASRIGVCGGSQGGALTLAAAAFSPIPVVATADYPYLSNFNRAIDITPEGPYGELNEYFRKVGGDPEIEQQAKRTLSYFDIMNLAGRVSCRTWMSVGLVDVITPPSTIFAVYNHLTCQKQISVNRYFGHEFIPRAHEERLRVLLETIG
ncbi:acetylxylan esterase [Paenibacillus tarimensis]|uniref:acetylxylan esterase n=1 Tax=Paenibacillus tarimensis TaxID=416012 RepID=UPI001F1DC394|nr:acetylxylan esterase [Paenibacillus tarimensis]MCF2943485.1 acetylxylan esterase [Paenibacillus tarimensis]